MTAFATVNDLVTLYGITLSEADQERVEALLEMVSDELRYYAHMANKDLDCMIEHDAVLVSVAKEVTVSVTFRILRQSTEGEPMTQMSQSALGYSVSGTYAVPGGGIGNAIMDRDLKRLGLKRPRIGAIELYGPNWRA